MEFKEFAQRPDAYAKICSMIGPSIYGHSDVKKAIACLLFGGSKKVFCSYPVAQMFLVI